jgi:hypothetical protein
MSTILFQNRDRSTRMVQPTAELQAERYSFAAKGGPKLAELLATGSEYEVLEFLEFLRRPVEIYSDLGERVWWGFVSDVAVRAGRLAITVSIDSVANRIAVAWTEVADPLNDSGEQRQSGWLEDADSIATYGRRELVLPVSGTSESYALAARAMALEMRKYPAVAITIEDSPVETPEARLTCRGWYQTLDWVYFGRDEGLELSTAGSGAQALGRALTSTALSFTDVEVQALGDQPADTRVSAPIVYEFDYSLRHVDVELQKIGAPADNLVLTICADDEDRTVLASASRAGSGLPATPGTARYSLASNLGLSAGVTYHVTFARSGVLSAVNYYRLSCDEDSPGGAMQCYHRKSEIRLTDTTDVNFGNAAGTATVDRTFTAAADSTLLAVYVDLRKVDDPTDSVTLSLRADSSGSAGAVLAAVTLDAEDLSTSRAREKFEFTGGERLVSGSTYHLVLSRTGSLSASKYYTFGGDEDAAVALVVEEKSAWAAREPGATLAFATIDAAGEATQYAQARQRIHSPANGLLDFASGSMLLVSGSAANDGQYTVDATKDLNPGGSTLTLTPVQRLANEAAGAAVTLTSGLKVAQGFVFSNPWTLQYIDLYLATVGSPTDPLVVEVRANSAGSPGILIASTTIAAAEIGEAGAWVRCTVAGTGLAAETLYHLVVARSGSPSMDNYYEVGVTEGLEYADGALRIWSEGNGWTSRDPDADLLFRLSGDEDTALQAARIAADCGQLIQAVQRQVTSGLATSQYRDGSSRGLDELNELLEMGTANKRRMLASVDPDGVLWLTEEPALAEGSYQLDRTGRLFASFDIPVRAETCPVGVWVRLKDLLPATVDTEQLGSPTLMFIEEAEYEVATGRLALVPRGVESPWDIGRPRDG